MSLLEDLIGMPLDQIDDAMLEQAVIEGRLGREYVEPVKTRKASQKKSKIEELGINMDDFD